VRQYQVTVNPNALASYKLPLDAVITAVRRGNNDVGGRLVEVGDPGTTHDLDTPRADLPAFEAPPEPAAEHHHEWGSPAAAGTDEAPEPARSIE